LQPIGDGTRKKLMTPTGAVMIDQIAVLVLFGGKIQWICGLDA
jgi:hypothetical protein